MSSSRGFGGIVRSGADQSGGAGGVLTLDNGLTLTGTNGQLGGPLIHNTAVQLAGFNYQFSSGLGGSLMFLDDDFGTGLASFGFDSGFIFSSYIQFEQNRSFMAIGPYQALDIDSANGLFLLGDTLGSLNGTVLSINDQSELVALRSAFAGDMLLLDGQGRQYAMGDIWVTNNGTIFTIDDLATEARIQNATGNQLYINSNLGLYFLGNDSISSGLALNTNAQFYSILDQGADFLSISASNGECILGDAQGVLNGMQIRVENNSGLLQILNTAMDAAVEINGNLGFTGTVAAPASITVEGGIVTNVT